MSQYGNRVSVTAETYARLRVQAKARGIAMHQLIAEALDLAERQTTSAGVDRVVRRFLNGTAARLR